MNDASWATLAQYAEIRVLAARLQIVEDVRKAQVNRLKAWRRIDPEVEALKLGDLDRDDEHELVLAENTALLSDVEKELEVRLERAMRAHPLGPWVDHTVGLGEKTVARFLAVIGDPALRASPSQLWAYCGLHVIRGSDPSIGVAPARRRGQRLNWNPDARAKLWVIANGCRAQDGKEYIRQGEVRHPGRSPYRDVYDAGKEKYADALHAVECFACGQKKRRRGELKVRRPPVPAGSPLRAKHKHARADRLVMKAILVDLWVEARRLREGVWGDRSGER